MLLFFEQSALYLSSLPSPECFCAQYLTDALGKKAIPLNGMSLHPGQEWQNA